MIGCTVGPRAVDGTRCGLPAVVAWSGSDGARLAECIGHAVAYGTVDPAARPARARYCRRAACVDAALGPGRVTHAPHG